MSSRIRPYLARDQRGVVALWETVFPDDPPWNKPEDIIARKLKVQPELFFVCAVDKRVVGTVLAGFDGVRGWIHKLAVHPDYQRQGIAGDLMVAAEAGLAGIGCSKVNLQVRRTNASVAAFYRAAGYADEDRISLGKRLAPADPD